MSDHDAAATGQQPGRRRGASAVRGCLNHLTGRRAARALVGTGLAVALLATGFGLGRATDQPQNAVAASAPADLLAGTRIEAAETLSTGSPARIKKAFPDLEAGDPASATAVAIHIPRLKVSQQLIGLHVQPDRSLSVPKSFQDIGWWAEGPRPGAAGATLLAGHVSSKAGPGVFFKLKDMRDGDKITVDRADGTSAVFKVVGKASYPRSNFPDDVVYRAQGKPSIHLVTCDGAFDTSIGHHADNLVVFADLVSTAKTKGA